MTSSFSATVMIGLHVLMSPAHPSMTSRGKRIASVIALIVLFFLPKHVDCGYPDAECGHDAILRQWCKEYEVEPVGFWVIEKVAHRNIGFAYTTGESCT